MLKSFLIKLLSPAILLALAPAAGAIVVHGGTGTSNPPAHLVAPAHEPGWFNVGRVGGGSGIYLGNQWVLTAAHVGAGNISLNGVTFAQDTGTSPVRLTNTNGSLTDLLLFRLTTAPALPSLTIASTLPFTNDDLTLIGYGERRTSALSSFTFGSPPTTQEGYTSGNSGKAWGYNRGEVLASVDAGFGAVESIGMFFDRINGDGQARPGDSGGALFNANNELLGVLHAISVFQGQPNNTAIFDNITWAADLTRPHYRNQILAVIPEPMAFGLMAPMVLLVLRRRR